MPKWQQRELEHRGGSWRRDNAGGVASVLPMALLQQHAALAGDGRACDATRHSHPAQQPTAAPSRSDRRWTGARGAVVPLQPHPRLAFLHAWLHHRQQSVGDGDWRASRVRPPSHLLVTLSVRRRIPVVRMKSFTWRTVGVGSKLSIWAVDHSSRRAIFRQ